LAGPWTGDTINCDGALTASIRLTVLVEELQLHGGKNALDHEPVLAPSLHVHVLDTTLGNEDDVARKQDVGVASRVDERPVLRVIPDRLPRMTRDAGETFDALALADDVTVAGSNRGSNRRRGSIGLIARVHFASFGGEPSVSNGMNSKTIEQVMHDEKPVLSSDRHSPA